MTAPVGITTPGGSDAARRLDRGVADLLAGVFQRAAGGVCGTITGGGGVRSGIVQRGAGLVGGAIDRDTGIVDAALCRIERAIGRGIDVGSRVLGGGCGIRGDRVGRLRRLVLRILAAGSEHGDRGQGRHDELLHGISPVAAIPIGDHRGP
jgi:hypothetical protein